MAVNAGKSNRILYKLGHQILPALYIPVILVFTLVLQCASISNANIHIDNAFARHQWYLVVCLLTLYPAFGSLKMLWGRLQSEKQRPQQQGYSGRRVQNIILLLGIFTSHVVTVIAWYRGEISARRFIMLLMYDLIVLGSWFYWNREQESFVKGFQILAVILWLSALYGIAEHFFYGKIPELYTDKSGGVRVISIFANTIPAGSMWLMGLWFPFPGGKRFYWLDGLVKVCFVLAIFFTGSKNAWLGLAFSGIICCIFAIKREGSNLSFRRNRRVLVVIIAVLAAGLFLGSQFGEYLPVIMERWDDVQTQGSFLARMQHIQDTVKHMQAAGLFRKLFGFGYATSWQFIEDSPHYYGTTVRCIDNQYFTSLFEFGLLSSLCICIWCGRIFSHLSSKNEMIRGASFGLLAMLFPLWSYDPFRWEIIMAVMLPLSVVMLAGETVEISWRKVISGALTAGAAAAAGIILIPKGIRGFRTIARHYAAKFHLASEIYELLLWGAAIVFAFAVLIGLYLLISRENGKKKTAGIIVLCIGLTGGIILSAGTCTLIKHQQTAQAAVLEEEADVMKLITSSAGGKVVVDKDPSVYQLQFGGISPELFEGEKIIRADETTLVTDRNYEAKGLLEIGFLFAEISKHHAVYSDDPKVQETLAEAGFHLTGYYSASRELPCETVAENGETLYRSQTVYLYPGKYTVVRKGKEDSTYDKNPGSNIKVIGSGTREELASAENEELLFVITASSSAVDGKEPVYFETADSAGFSGNEEQQRTCYLELVQTPDWDIHSTYDYGDHRIRDEFYTLSGEKTKGGEGAFAVTYEYDRLLQVKKRCYYDKEDHPVLNTGGYAKVVQKNQKNGPVKISYYGTEDEPVFLTNGICVENRSYDAAGNLLRSDYYDSSGNPVLVNSGYAGVQRFYDEQKRLLREEYYDKDGDLISLPSRAAVCERDYDVYGNPVTYRYLGPDNKPVVVTSGYAAIHYEYNDRHYIIGESYEDAEGNPAILSNGCSVLLYTRDARNNITETGYYDASGRLILTPGGYAKIIKTYDTDNRVTNEAYYDADGQPAALGTGQTAEGRTYDELGNLTSRSYLDINGDLFLTTNGYAQICYEYNAQKMVTEEAYYDTSGNPVQCTGGYASVSYVRDHRGNAVETRYYDAHHNPVINSSGYAVVRRTYNEDNWLIREAYYDISDQLICLPGGQAAEEREYDKCGNLLCRRYYGADEKPVIISTGYAQIRYQYNDKRMVIRETYHDRDENHILLPAGYASLDFERDERGNCIRYTYQDLDGKPVVNSSGYAQLCRTYDVHNWIVREEYKDTDGSPIELSSGQAAEEHDFDAKGNVIGVRYYDRNGSLIQ